MSFAIDVLDDRVLEWTATVDGAVVTEREGYQPRLYVASRDPELSVDLGPIRAFYDNHPDVVSTSVVERRPGFRRDLEPVLAVDAAGVDRVPELARGARTHPAYPVGDLACFNVDFSPGFRYCLECDVDPTPTRELTRLRLGVPLPERDRETYGVLEVGDETVRGSPDDVLDAVSSAMADRDPDVLVCSTAEIVPTLYRMARAADREAFTLSRYSGIEYRTLAGRSTYESYGRVGHSPARYAVPGRAILDESNTFFYHESNLDGLLDLVARSRKPLQEVAWASIGNVLTAIGIREAHDRGVLTPWNAWRHEAFKPMGTLHDADRGGFVFAPDVGFHEDVHELDFSSLYPNVIVTRNVSPDVIECACHRERADVPELDYAICDEAGYLVDVLGPIIDDRDAIKAAIRDERARDDPDSDRLAALEGRSSALKWILVACFGYQGFNNAKFGRIECHEAINAFAREILLTAKRRLEAGGWCVRHGIVDSIWVTPDPAVADADRRDLEELAAEITQAVDIRLEYEAHYEWVAFVPQRDSAAGALTKYVGKRADVDVSVDAGATIEAAAAAVDDAFKCRGIEARQRSTPPFVRDVQLACLERLDATRSPAAVVGRLERAIGRLHDGDVDPAALVERRRVSKPAEAYTQYTRSVAALERARDQAIDVLPGQDVTYVVVDDGASSRDRVALAHEAEAYDPAYYETLLVRAVESVLSPLGWDREKIQRALDGRETVDLRSF